MSYYIYKICCDDCLDYVYVGSTKAFRQRKNNHKQNCNNMKDRKIYNTIREHGGWDNWRMVILEDCGEISFTEARIKEEEHRVKLNANLNTFSCYLTKEQKEQYIKENKKEYYKQNKEKILNYQKEKMTCDCGKKFSINHKSRHLNTLFHKKYISNIIVNEDSESP